MKYGTIAVGTDGSDTSLIAVRKAAALARDCGAELVIICAHRSSSGSVLGSPGGDGTGAPVVGDRAAAEDLEEARAVAADEGAERIRTLALPGAAVGVLTESIAETGADLLVLGNAGMNSLTGRLLGNVPAAVLKRSRIDVMLVRTDAAEG